MTPEIILSLVAIAISIILPVCVMFWSIHINTRLQKQLEKSVLRPEPIVDVIIDTSASLQIHPRNLGNVVAHNYTIDIKYPSESEIISIENEYFEVKEGGLEKDFVKLYREKFPPNTMLPPIRIDAEKGGKVVLPIEVSVVCKEQKGMISFPPLRE